MALNKQQVFGTLTVITIVGFTGYAIYKYRKQSKLEEQAISVEEARDIVERASVEESLVVRPEESTIEYIKEDGDLDIEQIKDDIHDEVNWNASFANPKDLEEPDFTFDNMDFVSPLKETMTEEDTILRYEPNSNDARTQFIKMELAEWVPMEDTYLTMLGLYKIPFEPTTEDDDRLKDNLKDYRAQFFGNDSRWVDDISMADVIMHYGRSAAFHLDEGVRYWVDYFLARNGLYHSMLDSELNRITIDMNNHEYHGFEYFGLLGLTNFEYAEVEHRADETPEGVITYDIEFNVFLESQQ